MFRIFTRKLSTETQEFGEKYGPKFLNLAGPPILASIFTLFTYGVSSTISSTYNNTLTMNGHDLQLKSLEKSIDNLDNSMKERFQRVDDDIKRMNGSLEKLQITIENQRRWFK